MTKYQDQYDTILNFGQYNAKHHRQKYVKSQYPLGNIERWFRAVRRAKDTPIYFAVRGFRRTAVPLSKKIARRALRLPNTDNWGGPLRVCEVTRPSTLVKIRECDCVDIYVERLEL